MSDEKKDCDHEWWFRQVTQSGNIALSPLATSGTDYKAGEFYTCQCFRCNEQASLEGSKLAEIVKKEDEQLQEQRRKFVLPPVPLWRKWLTTATIALPLVCGIIPGLPVAWITPIGDGTGNDLALAEGAFLIWTCGVLNITFFVAMVCFNQLAWGNVACLLLVSGMTARICLFIRNDFVWNHRKRREDERKRKKN
jgi:hypothetical protein